MSFYDQKINSPRESMMTIPPITNGISDSGWAQDATQGFATTLDNCTYQGQQLLLGRGEDTELVGTSYFATIGAFDKVVYDNATGKYYGITIKAFCEVSLSTGTVTSIDTTTSSPGFTDICMFNGDVLVAKNTYLYRYDGSHLYSCGSIEDNITLPIDYGNLSDTDYTSAATTTVTTGTTGSARTRLINVQALLKKTGTITGYVNMEFTDDTTTWRSEKVNIDVGIGYQYAVVSFDMIDPPDLAATTGWTLKITTSAGDASNYISLADISSTEQIRLNGPTTPRATSMCVFKGRLYCIMADDDTSAPAEGNPVYYCKINNADDWFSTSSDGTTTYGGYFYLNDDVNSRVYGLSIYRHYLAVSGFSAGKTRTELLNNTNTVENATTDAVSSQNCLQSTPTQLFLLHSKTASNNFAMYAWSGVDLDVTMRPNLAAMVAQGIGDQYSTTADKIIAEVDDWADTLWVLHGEQDTAYIYHIKSGQWTTFSFGYDIHGLAYVAGKMLVFGADGTINEYKHGAVSSTAETTVETKKMRVSHFTRMRLAEFIWYIEHSGFTGQATIKSELGGIESNYYISGDPPKPVRVRGIKDMSFTFKLTDVGITTRTPVGELVCKLTNDGRSVT